MIELARHIEILLLDNDCVIVPDLGGFVAHHVDACYEQSEYLFLPPQRVLGFNPQLRINDSLLAQSYAEAYDISYPEAVRRIEDEVNELRQHIENEGSYELSGIGTLKLNDEGHLEFSPYESGILTPSLYGLGAFEMEPLNQQEVADTNSNKTGDKAIVIYMSWLRNAVAVVAAVVCFFLYTTPVSNISNNGWDNVELGSLDFPIPATKSTTDVTPKVKEAPTEDKKEVVTEVIDSVKVSEETSTDSLDKPVHAFCIVLATDVAENNAREFVDKMQKNGFDQTRIYVHNNLRRVIYGTYASETEAYNDLRTLRRSKAFEEAWVYEMKDVR